MSGTSVEFTARTANDRESVDKLFEVIACMPPEGEPVVQTFMAVRLSLSLGLGDDDMATAHLAVGYSGFTDAPYAEIEDATFLIRDSEGMPWARVAVVNGKVIRTWPLAKVVDGELVPNEEDDDV